MNNQLVSSSSFSSPPSWEYDVFLSFRGEDTRTNFTDHFYKALDDKAITTFIDHQLKRGEEIFPALLEAIEESRISIIVFSENYASSRWCLDELVHILECRKSRKQIVLPVFYKVDPSDVRKQTSSFGDAFTEKFKFEDNKEKILTWRSALTDAASLSGYTFKEGEYEATFISKIVEEIFVPVQQCTHLKVANYPVGMESCVEKVKELLGVSGNDPCVVGIWGSSGIGKTTVAKAVYNAIAYEFEGSCFLADVRETSIQYGGLLQLQNTLLSEIGGSEWKAVNLHRGNILIKKLLRGKKILLILDDVDDFEQLDNLVEVHQLGEGSRVIITTKNKGLLESCKVELIYKVQKLEDNKAIELFSWNAFGKEKPPDVYLGLARRAIAYAQGLPLALNLIGSHLRGKNIVRWQDILDSYNEEPHRGIQRVLRKSYDTLEYVQQQLFLDIACFFKGEVKDKVLQILKGSNLKVRQHCIDVLVENAIITIEDNRILMHDLLEQMGKHIVWEESPTEPGERSRLWLPKDVYRVLTKNRGTKKIKGIVVKLPVPDVIPLNTKSFSKMVNLEIFIIRNAHFSGCVEYLPDDLRWIEFGGLHYWRSNILQKHILTFNLQSNCHLRNFVTFIMPNSDIRQLKVFQNLANLTSLNLSGSEFLEKIPNLSGSPNLRELILDECKRLVEVDDSVGFLDKLVTLSLVGCSRLERFARRLRLRSLQRLYFGGCTRLKSFPEIEVEMESLRVLNITKSGIRELPSSIAYLTGLKHLWAMGCENLTGTSLHHIYGLQRLHYIEMSRCPKLVTFGKFSTCLDTSHDNGIPLALPNVGYLFLNGCNLSESDFHVPFHCLSKSIRVYMGGNNFVSLPECISKFVNLEALCLTGCKRLREIPHALPPNLRDLYLDYCTSLEKIPKLPSRLRCLELTNCFRISGDEVAKLENNLLNLNQESHRCSQLQVTYPGDEIPKRFSYTSKHLTATRIEGGIYNAWQQAYVGGSEFSFEIPLNLQEREMLLGLALSCVFPPLPLSELGYRYVIRILINKASDYKEFELDGKFMEKAHVGLMLVDLEKKQGDICKVKIQFPEGAGIKICGVHPLFRKEDERLPLSLGPTSSLGSSDIIDDEYDWQQQWPSLSSNPADDHPKRTQIDHNVLSDIEEEQEQPSIVSWVSACVGCLNFWCKPRK
ncbi:TMV resistance protein N-like [Malus domestica]|uniref:TMV resistance protein N-like n=1 Tax=Malus domestica TaxID=3750 RepID=UPI0010A9A5C2|nr:TMV resistance protein N-like [Malus domestica]XP_028945612.1 TMV resistance protein N-like [Malus domestica]XP_028945614.1 TMV resistance protein N-like [Malus domestica]XP_028945615.1 TMV resistance protein N-like [Malus domestica]